MDTKWTFLSGMGLGATVMFFLEPSGTRRRAVLRDKTFSAGKTLGRWSGKASRHIYNRSKGLAIETVKHMRDDNPTGEILVERVRSQMGRVVSDPGAIQVTANEGRVILRGPVLASEVDRLLTRVKKVRGVKDVANQVTVHGERGNEPPLQGHRNWTAGGWSPAAKVLSGIAAGTVAVYAVAKRVA